MNDLVVGAGAKVTYVCTQDWSDTALGIQINATTVGRDASALNLYLNLGAKLFAPRKPQPTHRREAAAATCSPSRSAIDAQEFDARTLQDHASPHTYSDLLYKNALTTRRATFSAV